MGQIAELQKEVHKNAKNKGFHEGEKNTGEMLALIHSEVSEALEADRIDKYCKDGTWMNDDTVDDYDGFVFHFKDEVKDTFDDELADIVIRVMDLAELKGINLESHIIAKMRYNSTRENKHGKRY